MVKVTEELAELKEMVLELHKKVDILMEGHDFITAWIEAPMLSLAPYVFKMQKMREAAMAKQEKKQEQMKNAPKPGPPIKEKPMEQSRAEMLKAKIAEDKKARLEAMEKEDKDGNIDG